MVTIITEKLQNQTLEDVQAAEQNMPITQVTYLQHFEALRIHAFGTKNLSPMGFQNRTSGLTLMTKL